MELFARWGRDLDAIRDLVVPEPFDDWQYYGLFWREFFAVCALYDPPETELLSFAGWGGPNPSEKEPAVPMVMMPAAREQRDWIKSENAQRWYYEAIIREVAERLRDRQGVDLWPIIREVQSDLGPKLHGELSAWEERNNPFRWVIDPEAAASRDDVVKAWRFARTRSAPSGRPPMDRLTATQCAVLYDDHNLRDPEDRRLKHWTYKRLADEFGLGSERSAEEHVRLGRKLRGTK